jgi:hypothetical protein
MRNLCILVVVFLLLLLTHTGECGRKPKYDRCRCSEHTSQRERERRLERDSCAHGHRDPAPASKKIHPSSSVHGTLACCRITHSLTLPRVRSIMCFLCRPRQAGRRDQAWFRSLLAPVDSSALVPNAAAAAAPRRCSGAAAGKGRAALYTYRKGKNGGIHNSKK